MSDKRTPKWAILLKKRGKSGVKIEAFAASDFAQRAVLDPAGRKIPTAAAPRYVRLRVSGRWVGLADRSGPVTLLNDRQVTQFLGDMLGLTT
jgi:hypothetical protein